MFHSQVRSDIALKNFCVVDTPGMIDSPMVRDSFGNTRHAVMDRGYDFEVRFTPFISALVYSSSVYIQYISLIMIFTGCLSLVR